MCVRSVCLGVWVCSCVSFVFCVSECLYMFVLCGIVRLWVCYVCVSVCICVSFVCCVCVGVFLLVCLGVCVCLSPRG